MTHTLNIPPFNIIPRDTPRYKKKSYIGRRETHEQNAQVKLIA